MSVAAVDLFCGAGGLTAGLLRAGIDVRAGYDVDPACRWAYEYNNGVTFHEEDVSRLSSAEVRSRLAGADVRILAGCAPCQPFSSYGRTRRGEDDRWRLLAAFESIALDLRPELLTMENVPGLVAHPAFKQFVGSLDGAGYSTAYGVLHAEEHGVPQRRRRLVLIASRIGPATLPVPIAGPEPTVRDAIACLPSLEAGGRDPQDPLHAAASLTDINMKRMKASLPGGSWRDWPKNLLAPCHVREAGKGYTPVYGRMSWDAPSPTITTQFYNYGSGRFGHPDQNRALSLREGALLQSFPSAWAFVPPGTMVQTTATGRAIGNAVPPALAKSIGLWLLRTAGEHPKAGLAA